MRDHRRNQRSGRIIETLILFALPFVLHFVVPIRTLIRSPYTYLGVLVMAGGLYIANQARTLFKQADTSFQLEGEAHTLVTEGPFRYSRNPIYLGMLLWLLGLAMLLGSLGAFILPVAIFLLMNFVMIPFEERRMQEVCGEEFIAYKARVRRWF